MATRGVSRLLLPAWTVDAIHDATPLQHAIATGGISVGQHMSHTRVSVVW